MDVKDLEEKFDPDFNNEVWDAIGLAMNGGDQRDAYKRVLEVVADKFK